MKKPKDQVKLQVTLSRKAFEHLQKIVNKANDSFEDGHVHVSQCVEYAILHAKYSFKEIQKPNINAMKLLQNVVQEADDLSPVIEAMLKMRQDIRAKKQSKASSNNGGGTP